MALSDKSKKRFIAAMARRVEAQEIIDAINSQAVNVAPIGTTANLVAPAVIGDAAPLVGTEARLDVIEAKIDALIAALRTAGLMA